MKPDLPNLLGDDVLHPVYLPFSAGTLSQHFAPLSTPGTCTAEDYLRYYRESADRYKKFLAEVPDLRSLPLSAVRNPCQIDVQIAGCGLGIAEAEHRFHAARREAHISGALRSAAPARRAGI